MPLGTPEAPDVRRLERLGYRIRLSAAGLALAHTIAYPRPMPANARALVLAVLAIFALANLPVAQVMRSGDLRTIERAARAAVALSAAACVAVAVLFAFDDGGSVWVLLYLPAFGAASRYGARGGLAVMVAGGAAYAGAAAMAGNVDGTTVAAADLVFRVGVGCLLAYTAGTVSSALRSRNDQLTHAVDRLTIEQRRSGSLLEALSDANVGFVVGDGRRFLSVNDAFCRITGYTREELVAMPSAYALMEPEEAARLAERFMRRVGGEDLGGTTETWMRHRDGSRVDLEISIKLLWEDGEPRVYTITRDITDRKWLDRMKDAFLSAVSHELRTPLTGVVGFAHTLDREGEMLDAQTRIDIIRRIAANAEKLERLLADLLDLSRLNQGVIEPNLRPADLADVVRAVVDADWSGGRRIVLDTEPVTIAMDVPKVERIVENLLGNAAKYGPPGGAVTVRLRARPDGALLSVEDEGVGVPEHLREQIFEPFERGAQSRAHSPGVGIGLSLVSRFAELHGGRAWVEERPGGGASFKVFLPMGREPAAPPRPLFGRRAPQPPQRREARDANPQVVLRGHTHEGTGR